MRYVPAFALALVTLAALPASAADEALLIPKGAKVYVAPMDGFETYLSAAIMKKEVPVSLVTKKGGA